MATLFQTLDPYLKQEIYHLLPPDEALNLAEATGDLSHAYAPALNLGKPLLLEYLHEVAKDHPAYQKLFTECPYLRDLPQDQDLIVSGGFINIALDQTLDYKEFTTSDIDIFICGQKMMEILGRVLEYFDTLDATYKEYDNIVNVYLPDYSRNFQIICVDNPNVCDVLARFHASHVKCGLHCGQLKMTPDCGPSIRYKVAIVKRGQLTMSTLVKILKRGYTIKGMERYKLSDILPLDDQLHEKTIAQKLEKCQPICSGEVASRIIGPCNFSQYRCAPTTIRTIRSSYGLEVLDRIPIQFEFYHYNRIHSRNPPAIYLTSTYQDVLDTVPFYEKYPCSGILTPPISGTMWTEGKFQIDTASLSVVHHIQQKLLAYVNLIFQGQITLTDPFYHDQVTHEKSGLFIVSPYWRFVHSDGETHRSKSVYPIRCSIVFRLSFRIRTYNSDRAPTNEKQVVTGIKTVDDLKFGVDTTKYGYFWRWDIETKS